MKSALKLLVILPLLVAALGCASKEKVETDPYAEPTTYEYIAGERREVIPTTLQPVYFDFDKYNIRPDARATLEVHYTFLRGNPQVNVQVEGHCDERGSEEYNLALGERRALAVKNYLVGKGISAARLTFISYGEERPVDPRSNETAWALNRRGEFVLYR